MKRLQQIRICDYLLAIVMIVMLASSIQLEILAASIQAWVWLHIALGILFFGLIGWHLQLHFQWRNWFSLLRKQKTENTKWLAAVGVLTLLTAIAANVGWIITPDHSTIGAVHGKLGFVMLILALWHVGRRLKFYRSSKK